MHPKKIAELAREAALDKKGEDPIILDLNKLNTVARYFVIVHGNSHPHVKAIADHMLERIKKKGGRVLHIEGKEEGLWILLDFGMVIAHIFHRQLREYYCLERLWGEAPRI